MFDRPFHSTKVMEYREEMRTTTSRSRGKSTGGGAFSGATGTRSTGGAIYDNEEQDPNSWNESVADSVGDSNTWTESESKSETETSILVPIMGKELAHVQFRSLEEQLFRAMAVLFDQEQRHGVARIVGMSAPVSLVTPEVLKMPSTPDRRKQFLDRQYAKLPFALPTGEAQKQITDRAETFVEDLFKELSQEPVTIKRKIR